MYQPVTLFIGLRYSHGHAADKFGKLVAWLSTIGITLGVMAMIMVLSVMNGFQDMFQNKILQLMPQAIITTPKKMLDPAKITISTLKNLQGVKKIVPLITAEVMLQSRRNITLGVLLGITPEQYEPLSDFFLGAKQQALQPGSYNIIIGSQLAESLNVNLGETVRIMVPSVTQLTPLGRIPNQRLFTVSGIFAAGSELDSEQLVINQQDAARLMGYPAGNISGWRLFLNKPLQVDSLSQQALPIGTIWQDWRQRKGDLFAAVQMEKNMMTLLLSLIIAVAAFNIITSLGLLVMGKSGEIAILQTQGMSLSQIKTIFIIQGASAGIIGALLGSLLGVLFASQLDKIPLLATLILGSDMPLPVVIKPIQVVSIALLAIVIALLATLYPSWHAATTDPAEALRYE